MSEERSSPGSLASDKMSESGQGRPEPEAAEVESARLLANSARQVLHADGMDDEDILQAADEFIALDLGEDTEQFVSWVRERGGSGTTTRPKDPGSNRR